MVDPTQRFSDRAEYYARYRPSYPAQVVDVLAAECGLTPEAVIADIGSGTGILTELFLQFGNRVYGVEPNREMRQAGERHLQHFPAFISIDGTAEATALPGGSVDFITAGQAFHWFERARARAEFARILKPGGWVMLAWNGRVADGSPFLADYESLLGKYGTDYAQVDHRRITDETIAEFYSPSPVRSRAFPNPRVQDYDSLAGGLLSASYAPQPGHPNYEPMMAELRVLFDVHQANGTVTYLLETTLYYGQLEG